jgi:hypothetical protein
MQTVTKENLEALCREVLRDAPALLQGINDDGERNETLLRSLYEKVCKKLGLDPAEQARGLGNSAGFLLMQTLEEHMQPDFLYTDVLDRQLLIKAQHL